MGTTTTTTKKALNDSPPPDTKSAPSDTNGAPSPWIRRSESESDRKPHKLWWAPKQSQVEIRSESVKYRNVQAKVGSLTNTEYRPGGGQVAIRNEPLQWQASSRVNSLSNANWSPSVPRRVSVRQEKLKWNAQPKVNSLDNVNYKPGGRDIVEIYDEKLDFKHVTSRVNCGFAD